MRRTCCAPRRPVPGRINCTGRLRAARPRTAGGSSAEWPERPSLLCLPSPSESFFRGSEVSLISRLSNGGRALQPGQEADRCGVGRLQTSRWTVDRPTHTISPCLGEISTATVIGVSDRSAQTGQGQRRRLQLSTMPAAIRDPLPETLVRHHCARVFRFPMSVDPVPAVPLEHMVVLRALP